MTAKTVDSVILSRLWIYTNFDCNLSCSYCVARSSPRAERRGLALHAFRRLIDEARDCGVQAIFLTGGEPFLLPDISDRIRYAAERLPTTVLTNAMLFHGRRLEALRSLCGSGARFQVSLDGAEAETHDFYRGHGAWERTLAGIATLQKLGHPVIIGSTETPLNGNRLGALRSFVAQLGIERRDHFIRPLARRGFSNEGIDLSLTDVEPEVTVSVDGVFYHPLGCEDDLLVTRRIFPFAAARELARQRYQIVLENGCLPQRFR